MKKIFLLIPLLLITFGCVESELYIDGENVGNVDEETPVDGTILKTFAYETPFYDYQYLFNSEGKLTNINVSFLGATNNGTLAYNNGNLSSISPGMFSNQDALTYNEQNQLIEINSGSTPETKMIFTYNQNNIVGVRTIDGVEDNTVTFTLDNAGYITGYTFTDTTNGKEYILTLNVANNLLSSSTFTEDGNILQEMSFTYDNKINPIYTQTIDIFNVQIMMEAYGFDLSFPTLQLDSYAMYRSVNNITQMVASGSGSAFIQGTVDYEYTYDGDYPVSAILTVEGEDPGATTYTYY